MNSINESVPVQELINAMAEQLLKSEFGRCYLCTNPMKNITLDGENNGCDGNCSADKQFTPDDLVNKVIQEISRRKGDGNVTGGSLKWLKANPGDILYGHVASDPKTVYPFEVKRVVIKADMTEVVVWSDYLGQEAVINEDNIGTMFFLSEEEAGAGAAKIHNRMWHGYSNGEHKVIFD